MRKKEYMVVVYRIPAPLDDPKGFQACARARARLHKVLRDVDATRYKEAVYLVRGDLVPFVEDCWRREVQPEIPPEYVDGLRFRVFSLTSYEQKYGKIVFRKLSSHRKSRSTSRRKRHYRRKRRRKQ